MSQEAPKELAKCESEWPEVTFHLVDFQRLDNSHALAIIQIRTSPQRENVLMLGEDPLGGKVIPDTATPEEIESGKYDPRPFSLRAGTLMDELTGQSYKTVSEAAGRYHGPDVVLTSLHPGSGIQMAVYFEAPGPLPLNADGHRPEQKVTLQLPKAKIPFKNLVLPPEPK